MEQNNKEERSQPVTVTIIGGGLAGSEAALYLAENGVEVNLYEMRPKKMTPAHKTGNLAELICSNSLKSRRLDTGGGLLKAELRKIGSHLINIAEDCDIKSGAALTVDRNRFAEKVTRAVERNDKITMINKEIRTLTEITPPILVATGPLTSESLTNNLGKLLGDDYLYFFDAISPIISGESIELGRGFFESRYGKGNPNIFNCPMTEEEYNLFYEELTNAEVVPLKKVDEMVYFESCLPVEEIARRGKQSLLFGPLRPVGFENPKAENAKAVVQLRPEDKEGDYFNLIGFQTRLKYGEQKRVFRLIPALQNAEFIRFGSMHRNTFINSPKLLNENLELKKNPGIFFAGQLTGVEGYIESIAGGVVAGISILNNLEDKPFQLPPLETMTGGLLRSILEIKKKFQPINANFGIIPRPGLKIKNKNKRREVQASTALRKIETWKDIYVKD